MIAVFFASLVAVAVAGPTHHIVGGTESDAYSHPYIASLQRGYLGIFWSHSCGCSLLSETWCLTAAHCVDGASLSSLRVQLGEHSLSDPDPGEQIFSVSQIVMHPNYNGDAGGYPNDIALLKLSGAATITDYVRTIPLPSSDVTFEGETATISGWGRLVGGGSLADTLQEVDMTVIGNTECGNRWSEVSGATINDQHICIYDSSHQASACNGDSGGPMILGSGEEAVLIGVTSWGISTCGGDYPSVYTRVSKYRDWIQGYTGTL